jgi:hypothetical protein
MHAHEADDDGANGKQTRGSDFHALGIDIEIKYVAENERDHCGDEDGKSEHRFILN